MNDLVSFLESFNRKERYWLLRLALGEEVGLAPDFLKKLGQVCGGILIPEGAWWAIDYHLDWISGALHIYCGGEVGAPEVWDERIVSSSQQDVDLIVAFGRTVILIEAKGDTAWSNDQLEEKRGRLELIFGKYNNGLCDVHIVLVSPREPVKVHALSKPWTLVKEGVSAQVKPVWMELPMGKGSFLKTTRSDHLGKSSSKGDRWTIVRTAER
jgi:hypothetical protein